MKLSKIYLKVSRRDIGISLLSTAFIAFWVIGCIFVFASLAENNKFNDGIIFVVFAVAITGGGLLGTLLLRILARRVAPQCPQCNASLSIYLNKRKQYQKLIMGQCPQCEAELSQQSVGE